MLDRYLMNNRLIVAYVRLSQEDKNKLKDFSESIYNQIDLIKSYGESKGLRIDKAYIDDGFSGTNFERLGFQKLIADIEKGLVRVVITKDMSRLGRNFIECAYYISEYFPKYGVRYIAINDNFDSKYTNDSRDIVVSFKSLINDRYARDISIKRKKIADIKTCDGQFIGFIAPYGYKIVKKDGRRTLEIDEDAALIVKRIFTEIALGKTRQEVADGLNNDKILSPILYMNMRPAKNKKYYYDWSSNIIYRILKNKTYTGKIVKRKSIKKSYLQKNRKIIPIRERQVIDNCHEAIVTEELFNRANDKLIIMQKHEKKEYSGLLSGLVFCGECGRAMLLCKKMNTGVRYYFACTKTIDRKSCQNRTIGDLKLKEIIVSILQSIVRDYVCEEKIVLQVVKDLVKWERLNLKILYLKENIELSNKKIRNLYLQKVWEEITLAQFLEKVANESSAKKKLEQRLKEIERYKNVDILKCEISTQYKGFINDDKFMRMILDDLVDKIIIYKNNIVKILFKFNLVN